MDKRIIFDVGHPAQVHNFKHVYWELNKKGWTGLFTAKDKEVTLSLLEYYNLPYRIIGKSGNNLISKAFNLSIAFSRFFIVLLKFKPTIVVCRFSPHSVWCSRILNIPVIGLADTEHTRLSDSLTVPLASVKLTGYSYEKDLGKNHFKVDSSIELFYLHPKRYKSSGTVINNPESTNNQNYVLLRFVSWQAHHDIGERGLSKTDKINLIALLKEHYKVLISSEGGLPDELSEYKINIHPSMMHDVLADAALYIGEGASMASEAACLGIPSIYVNTLNAGSIKEEEKFGLVYNLRNSGELFQLLPKLINDPMLRTKAKQNLENFLDGKIDVTAFLVWFIENYPDSIKNIKENPEYQKKFV